MLSRCLNNDQILFFLGGGGGGGVWYINTVPQNLFIFFKKSLNVHIVIYVISGRKSDRSLVRGFLVVI